MFRLGKILIAVLMLSLLCGCTTYRINRLVKNLKNDPYIPSEDGPGQMSGTMKSLIAIGPRATGPLVSSLSKGDNLIHNVTVMVTLEGLGSSLPLKKVSKLLAHSGLGVAERAADIFKSRPGKESTKVLLSYLERIDPARNRVPPADPDAFTLTLECLEDCGTAAALEGMATRLDYPDLKTRYTILRSTLAIAKRSGKDSLPVGKIVGGLINNLSDEDSVTRDISLYSLSEITGKNFGNPRGRKGMPDETDLKVKKNWEDWWAKNRARFAG